ncbi:HAMP domain-containing histidine kinase [bacterium]|nr:HAMP domain-containing histidine kinase [bacterium]
MEVEELSKEELISETKRLYTENTRLKNELTQIWDSVKIFIAKFSHELKTPLNSIIGFTELLETLEHDEKSKDYISNIKTCSEHIFDLVNNIIDIVRSQYNKLELSYSFFDTKTTIENIINNFNSDNIDYTLIEKMICADYTRFKQLIYNLISNALKFSSDKQKIEIITYLEKEMFCFEITDYGEGISDDNKNKIFNFFSQVSEDLFKRKRGSGIGLSLCKAITDAHDGIICVESEIEKGSTFIVKLPIEKGIT